MSLTRIPNQLRAGDTWKWTATLSDYPATTWTLTYYLVRQSIATISFAASADGADHAVSVAAADTAAYTPGVYKYQAVVDDGTDHYQVEAGTVELLANFASGASSIDARSHARKVLDAVEALIEGTASKDQQEITEGGVTLKRRSVEDLLSLRDRYRAEVAAELRRERAERGLGTAKTIKVRFTS